MHIFLIRDSNTPSVTHRLHREVVGHREVDVPHARAAGWPGTVRSLPPTGMLPRRHRPFHQSPGSFVLSYSPRSNHASKKLAPMHSEKTVNSEKGAETPPQSHDCKLAESQAHASALPRSSAYRRCGSPAWGRRRYCAPGRRPRLSWKGGGFPVVQPACLIASHAPIPSWAANRGNCDVPGSTRLQSYRYPSSGCPAGPRQFSVEFSSFDAVTSNTAFRRFPTSSFG